MRKQDGVHVAMCSCKSSLDLQVLIKMPLGDDHQLCRRVERNAEGGFFQIFQENKWRLRKQKEAAAARRQTELSLL